MISSSSSWHWRNCSMFIWLLSGSLWRRMLPVLAIVVGLLMLSLRVLAGGTYLFTGGTGQWRGLRTIVSWSGTDRVCKHGWDVCGVCEIFTFFVWAPVIPGGVRFGRWLVRDDETFSDFNFVELRAELVCGELFYMTPWIFNGNDQVSATRLGLVFISCQIN